MACGPVCLWSSPPIPDDRRRHRSSLWLELSTHEIEQLLVIAYWLLLAYWLFPILLAYCLLPIAYCLLYIAYLQSLHLPFWRLCPQWPVPHSLQLPFWRPWSQWPVP
jgi:hypothetical protein